MRKILYTCIFILLFYGAAAFFTANISQAAGFLVRTTVLNTSCPPNQDCNYTWSTPEVPGYRAVGVNVRMHDYGQDYDAHPRVGVIDLKTGQTSTVYSLTDSCNKSPNERFCLFNQPCFDICTGGSVEKHEYIMQNYESNDLSIRNLQINIYRPSFVGSNEGAFIRELQWYFVPWQLPPPPGPMGPPQVNISGINIECPEFFGSPVDHLLGFNVTIVPTSGYAYNIGAADFHLYSSSTNYSRGSNHLLGPDPRISYLDVLPPDHKALLATQIPGTNDHFWNFGVNKFLAISPTDLTKWGPYAANFRSGDSEGVSFIPFSDDYTAILQATNTNGQTTTEVIGPLILGITEDRKSTGFLEAVLTVTGEDTAELGLTWLAPRGVQQFRVNCTPDATNCDHNFLTNPPADFPDPVTGLNLASYDLQISDFEVGTTRIYVRLITHLDDSFALNPDTVCSDNTFTFDFINTSGPTVFDGTVNDFCTDSTNEKVTASYSNPAGRAEIDVIGIRIENQEATYSYNNATQSVSPISASPAFTNPSVVIDDASQITLSWDLTESSIPFGTNQIEAYMETSSGETVDWTKIGEFESYNSTLADLENALSDPDNFTLDWNVESGNSLASLYYGFDIQSFTSVPPITDHVLACSGIPGENCSSHKTISFPTKVFDAQFPMNSIPFPPNAAATYEVTNICGSVSKSTVNTSTDSWMKTLQGDVFVNTQVIDNEIPIAPEPVVFPNYVADDYNVASTNRRFFTSALYSQLSSSSPPTPTSRNNTVLQNYTDQNYVRYYQGVGQKAPITNWAFGEAVSSLALANNKQENNASGSIANVITSPNNGIYHFTGNQTVPGNTTCRGEKIIILDSGDLHIQPPFFSQSKDSDACLFIVGGDITVDTTSSSLNSANTAYDLIEAFMIASGTFTTSQTNNDSVLIIQGGVIYNNTNSNASFQRTVTGSDDRPAEVILYDPKYLELFRDYLGTGYDFKVREVNYSGN